MSSLYPEQQLRRRTMAWALKLKVNLERRHQGHAEEVGLVLTRWRSQIRRGLGPDEVRLPGLRYRPRVVAPPIQRPWSALQSHDDRQWFRAGASLRPRAATAPIDNGGFSTARLRSKVSGLAGSLKPQFSRVTGRGGVLWSTWARQQRRRTGRIVASGVVVGSSMSASAALPARSPGNRAAWPRRRNRGRAGRSGEGAPGRSERISPSGLALRQDYPGDGTDESKSSHQRRHPEGRRTHRTRLTAIKVMTGRDRLQHPAAAPGETTHQKYPPLRAHAEHPAALGETTHRKCPPPAAAFRVGARQRRIPPG